MRPKPLIGRHFDGWHPPGLAHIAQFRSNSHTHFERIAFIGGNRNRVRHRAPEKVADHVSIPLKSAARKDHSPTFDLVQCTFALILDPCDFAIGQAQIKRRCIGENFNLLFNTCSE